MASSQAPTAGSVPTAQVVGNAFVHQYYHILHQSPELVYRFYHDSSKLGRPGADGAMSSITTMQNYRSMDVGKTLVCSPYIILVANEAANVWVDMQAINEKILSLGYSDYLAEIKTVDAQESYNGGVLVLVTGYLTGKDGVKRNFTQSFFLAPQDRGYFVLNDIFRYVEDVQYHDVNQGLANGIVAPATPDNDPLPVQEHLIPEQQANPSNEINVEEVYIPSDNEEDSVVEEEVPVAEVVDEIENESQIVAEPSSSAQEEAPKKSYASIICGTVICCLQNKSNVSLELIIYLLQLKVTKESSGAVPAVSPVRQAPANQERQVAPPPPPALAAEPPASTSNDVESANNHEGEADGHSIYIKGLPLNATPSQLEEEFKRFGPIKSGGVQVRSNKQQGFCFGFVEFEAASAMQSAIMASPINIGGRQAHVEEKRASSSRVNRGGRFPPGRGSGFRSDGARGRGNYSGGRGFSRGDFSNRNDFPNRGGGGGGRGGSSNRDGVYQRVDSNNGRMNRANGPMNGASKTVAPREAQTQSYSVDGY
ncbi:hypothetical protein Syun_006266 [Stephania yunnanensis]|uniref:G3BP-like protein n=1 Tax=Stephania yunnanensis TaxID=152371 RepID=A0AAP0PYD7_9MAGN